MAIQMNEVKNQLPELTDKMHSMNEILRIDMEMCSRHRCVDGLRTAYACESEEHEAGGRASGAGCRDRLLPDCQFGL